LQHFPESVTEMMQSLPSIAEAVAQSLVRSLDDAFESKFFVGNVYPHFVFLVAVALRDVATRKIVLDCLQQKPIVSEALLRMRECIQRHKRSGPSDLEKQMWLGMVTQSMLQALFVAINYSPAWCQAHSQRIHELFNFLLLGCGTTMLPLMRSLMQKFSQHTPSRSVSNADQVLDNRPAHQLATHLHQGNLAVAEIIASTIITTAGWAHASPAFVPVTSSEAADIGSLLEPLGTTIRQHHSLQKLKEALEDTSAVFIDPRVEQCFRDQTHSKALAKRLFTSATEHECAHCGVPESMKKLNYCAKCKMTKYCSANCQKSQWKLHKIVCVPRH